MVNLEAQRTATNCWQAFQTHYISPTLAKQRLLECARVLSGPTAYITHADLLQRVLEQVDYLEAEFEVKPDPLGYYSWQPWLY